MGSLNLVSLFCLSFLYIYMHLFLYRIYLYLLIYT